MSDFDQIFDIGLTSLPTWKSFGLGWARRLL
jgi:hypothetical protein